MDTLGAKLSEVVELLAKIPTNKKTLERIFLKRGIPTDVIAFYNHPNFLAAEQSDPSFLELYGAWVRSRDFDEKYESRVRDLVPVIVEVLVDEIERDGQMGVCVDASMMLTKMLEKLGIWCYAVKGSLTISHPSLDSPTHFWMYDEKDVAGHVWVVAPPFEIVDATVRSQPYLRDEAEYLPRYIALETADKICPEAQDFVAPSILNHQFMMSGPLPKDVHLKMFPDLKRVTDYFPSWNVHHDGAVLRYSAAGVTVSDAPSLHSITSRRWNGLLAGEMFDQVILPAIEG